MTPKPQTIDITQELWNDNGSENLSNETYHRLLIEQYKIYVEMNDRISARRVLFNVFFLTLHTGLLGILGLSLSHQPVVRSFGLLFITLMGALLMCYAWWRLAQYYRHISVAKNVVLSELERRLPCRPIGIAESKALSVDRPYNPLRRMEIYLPFIFSLLYVFCFCYVSYLSKTYA